MASNSALDLVFWANILAGSTLIFYAYFMWICMRGWIEPSPRFVKIVRFICLCLLLTPLAARYQYSEAVILYLSAAMFAVGGLLKLKRKLGL